MADVLGAELPHAGPVLAAATVRQALVAGAQYLSASDRADAATDARRLLAHVMAATALDLVRSPDRLLSPTERAAFHAVIARRRAGEPVSRIVGARGFYGRTFIVTPAVLDPRPETETLIDAALSLATVEWPRGAGLDILDIGTGSGCLLATLLAELPEARGVGLDPSDEALAVARRNAIELGVIDRARFLPGSIEDAAGRIGQRFSLIVSNPPYISTGTIADLAPDVRSFDPMLALDGGSDGLAIYRLIANELPKLMRPGWVLLEIGMGQADDVVGLFRSEPNTSLIAQSSMLCDMAGVQRCVALKIHL